MSDMFDVLMQTKEGGISRLGPYTKNQAESIARNSKTLQAQVEPHSPSAVQASRLESQKVQSAKNAKLGRKGRRVTS